MHEIKAKWESKLKVCFLKTWKSFRLHNENEAKIRPTLQLSNFKNVHENIQMYPQIF